MSLPYKFKVSRIISEGRTTQANINIIKDWLKTSLPYFQEEFIALFLLACENNIDNTKKCIRGYFQIKNATPVIFNNYKVDAKEITDIQKVWGMCHLPMDNNSIVLSAKLLDTNYRHYDMIAVIKLVVMHYHLIQIENPPNELIIVLDMTGIGFMHLTRLRMGIALSYLQYLQEGLPLNIRNIHILNTNYIFHRLLNLFKVFLSQKLLASLQAHPPDMKMEDFHTKWVPAKSLAKEHGGELPFEDHIKKTTAQLKDMQSFFDAEEKLRSNYKI